MPSDPGVPPPDAEALVRLAYGAVLRRDADAPGLANYAAALRAGRSFDWLIATLAASAECKAFAGQLFPLDEAPPLAIDVDPEPAALQTLWDQLAATWSRLGDTEPYWSVLTDDRFRAERMGADALAAFHETGEGDARRLDAWLHRCGLSVPPGAVCAEYGCGVGRITRALARRFAAVVAIDVSAPHLRAAEAQMRADGIGTVRFKQVRGPADLQVLDGVDVFYSVISLQHSPPPIIVSVLRRAFAGLNPGGIAFFQVPTYGSGYAYPSVAADQDGMEMHVVPQHIIHAAAHDAGLHVLEVQPDWCIGRAGEWISTTFLMRKPGRAPGDAVTASG